MTISHQAKILTDDIIPVKSLIGSLGVPQSVAQSHRVGRATRPVRLVPSPPDSKGEGISRAFRVSRLVKSQSPQIGDGACLFGLVEFPDDA